MNGRYSELAEQIVADSLERRLPALTPRRITLPGLRGKADVVVGMRRVGKTTYLHQLAGEALARGLPRDHVLHVNFEDERLRPQEPALLGEIMAAYWRRVPAARDSECLVLLDEIQVVPGWEQFIRRLLDTEAARLVVTGSSARLLAREIASSLRGRSLSTELLPFSFAESVLRAGLAVPPRWPVASRQLAPLDAALDRYLQSGGFPEVLDLDDGVRARVLQEYVDAVLFRDVVERHGIEGTEALRHLVRRLLKSPASRFSVTKFYNELKSRGVRVSKGTVHEHLAHLEDAFMVFLVPIDTDSEKRRLVNPRKSYLVDHGLARSLSFEPDRDRGHHLENMVYLELRRRGHAVTYLDTASGHEIDFVARRRGEPVRLVQCCLSIADATTREREMAALEDGMRELALKESVLVTLRESGAERLSSGRVHVVPAARFLLEEA